MEGEAGFGFGCVRAGCGVDTGWWWVYRLVVVVVWRVFLAVEAPGNGVIVFPTSNYNSTPNSDFFQMMALLREKRGIFLS